MGLEIFSLEGKVALITGSSKGLGEAMARALAEAGASVVINSRQSADAGRVADEIGKATGRQTIGIAADVTVRSDVERLIGDTVKRMGKLDILINNAGMNIRKPMQEYNDEEWHKVIETNLTGPFLCCRAAAPHFLKQRSGRVINLGSILSFVALGNRSAYSASKGAIVQFTRALALEWAPYNVTVNAICPGPFETDLNKPMLENPQQKKFFIERVPLGRWAQPKELAGAVIFLASEASSFITGTTLLVDGGWTAQ